MKILLDNVFLLKNDKFQITIGKKVLNETIKLVSILN